MSSRLNNLSGAQDGLHYLKEWFSTAHVFDHHWDPSLALNDRCLTQASLRYIVVKVSTPNSDTIQIVLSPHLYPARRTR